VTPYPALTDLMGLVDEPARSFHETPTLIQRVSQSNYPCGLLFVVRHLSWIGQRVSSQSSPQPETLSMPSVRAHDPGKDEERSRCSVPRLQAARSTDPLFRRLALKDDLARYEVSKGTVRFPLCEPVPVNLIERRVGSRLAKRSSKSRSRIAAPTEV